ncbi:MAG: glycosyltransferase [Thermoanaerobaculia bacterium]
MSLLPFHPRLLRAASWGWRRFEIRREGAALRKARQRLGYPPGAPARLADATLSPSPEQLAGARRRTELATATERAAGIAVAILSTSDRLHFALALVESVERHHPEASVHLLIVDGDGSEVAPRLGLRTYTASQIGLLDDPYRALKYTAHELSTTAKSYFLLHLAAATDCDRFIYLDADVRLYSPMTALLAELDRADFVVTPHTVAPFPTSDPAWLRPNFGDLTQAGVLNAGLFGVRRSPAALQFLDQWRVLTSAPGANSGDPTNRSDQHQFNWLLAFVENVKVFRDTSYNVAFWNLHERALGLSGSSGDVPHFTVEGQPLVAFHYSGFDLKNERWLSAHDNRHLTVADPALTALLADYALALKRHGASEWAERRYRFGSFPSGQPIDRRMRTLFKEHETHLRRDVDPFTEVGESTYSRALLSPAPEVGGLLPLLVARIRSERGDVRAAFPDSDIHPEAILSWWSYSGARESGYEALFDRHRPVIPNLIGMKQLLRTEIEFPAAFAGLREPLAADRQQLLLRLAEAGRHEAAHTVRTLAVETYSFSPIYVLRRLVDERPDLRSAHPRILDRDAAGFANWIRQCGVELDFLDADTADQFERAAHGRALARIFSFVQRHPRLTDRWPLALVGVHRHEFASLLIHNLANSPEYDLNDVVMYLWIVDEFPTIGLALALETPCNAAQIPSPILPEGQDRILEALVAGDPRFAAELENYRREQPPVPDSEAAVLRAQMTSAHASGESAGDATATSYAGRVAGVNLFGYFRSPSGLGRMSRGLNDALSAHAIRVQENLLGHVTLDDDIRPEEFVRKYDLTLDTNIFVDVPHLPEPPLRLQPAHVVAGRRNIAYLAWELREANPLWADYFREFDQVWAISRFAAQSLSAALDREVLVIPNAVKIEAGLESRESRSWFSGRRPFTFFQTFDANSSIARKNPEATIAAFAGAFTKSDDVRLVMRISNAQRAVHRDPLRHLVAAATATGLDIRFLTEPLTRRGVLELMSGCDAYVSLHHSEGFGLTCAEAMALGKPVIATGYSGNLEFMRSENSLLVDYKEIAIKVTEGPFRRGALWAEPDIAHAADRMRWTYNHREAARAIGERARQTVADELSPARVGERAARALGWL